MVDAQAYTDVSQLVMSRAMTLDERLARILEVNGGKSSFQNIKVDDVHNFNGMSGYNYWVGDELIAQLYMATLLSGTYVIYKRTYFDGNLKEQYDYYDSEGRFFYESESLDGQPVSYASISMDTTSPFINHIYNILFIEYDGTTLNFGNTGRIYFLESILNKFYQDPNYTLSVKDKFKDRALINIRKEIYKIENDKVLKWSERQEVFNSLKEVRKKILSTKRRAHGYNYMFYDFAVRLMDLQLNYKTFKQRPINNFFGALYKYTLGNLFWFAGTVRSNLGYSVALAIYGPFTFYFITQPMNPHAMWAVGKVRKAYVTVVNVFESDEETEEISRVADNTSDSVSTKQAGLQKNTYSAGKEISWDERMSNFKAMQIAYEADMVFAARMGRIEQFETQFNFPLTAEAAWMEMELYLTNLENTLKYNNNLDARYVKFLNNEKKRTLELQLYIWQKMGQFFLDHPFIVVDEDDEQPERNYYVGRQFIFFNKMTTKLAQMGMMDSAKTYQNIQALAKKFKKSKKLGTSVLDNLERNSKLFKQKDFLSTTEHRKYMRDQWEILFLQQNKKQEASSFSLQAYTWSVRNAMWLLQTIYSSKRSEIATMTYKYNLDNSGTHGVSATGATNEYLENMFHNLAMEFVGIRKEMAENLPGDNEARLRENVINNVKQYLIERDRLLNAGVFAATDDSEGTTSI
jgi:hypothetical protein